MHVYPASTETVRLALALGLVLSIVVYNRWRLSGGASIIAGILALFPGQPLYILATLAAALCSYWLVDYWLAKRFFLYERRRLVAYVLCGLGFQLVFGSLGGILTDQGSLVLGLYGVGFVFPGLIASDMNKQGKWTTLGTVLGLTVVTFLLLGVFQALIGLMGAPPVSGAIVLPPAPFSFPVQLFTLAVVVSILAGSWLYERKGLRSAGFVSAAYLAFFVLQPVQVLIMAVLGAFVYFLAVRILIPNTLIFGRVKYALILFTSLVLTWGLEITLSGLTHGRMSLLPGFSIILPVIIALIANDAEQQGLVKTYTGLGLTTAAVLLVIKAGQFFLPF